MKEYEVVEEGFKEVVPPVPAVEFEKEIDAIKKKIAGIQDVLAEEQAKLADYEAKMSQYKVDILKIDAKDPLPVAEEL